MTRITHCDVFIVDSDPKTRSELKLIANACGYSVMIFPDGNMAQEELRKTCPRLIVVELLLPGLDGFELCQAIRTELGYPDLPVLPLAKMEWEKISG